MSIAMIRGPDTIPAGQLWDEIRLLSDSDGQVQIMRSYRTINRIFGPHLDSTFALAPDLRPIRRWSSSESASDSIVYRADSAIGWAESQDGSRRIIGRQIPRDIVDPSSFDLIVRTAELSPDYNFSVQTYLASQDTVATLTATVVGAERVRQRDGSLVDCWRVQGDFANLPVTMWVDKVTRALVQETIRLSPYIAMYMLR